MSNLIQRLQRLSPQQRAQLAEQIQPQSSGPINTRLVAFVVPSSGGAIDPSAVRDDLMARLPDYMVPSLILPLDSLPLTPNGKIDRQALASIELTPVSGAQAGYAEPASDIEQALARIWSDVLGLDMLSLHDNFFEIGGDSILSIQIVARARQTGMELTPALLFKHPTIGELAAVVAASQPSKASAEQGLVSGSVPLTPIQHWFFENQLQRPEQWNQAILLRLRKPTTPDALRDAVRALLEQHDALRSRFIQQGNSWMQEQVGLPVELPVALLDLRGKPTAEQQILIEQTATQQHQSLRLALADLLQVTHIRMTDSDDTLLIVLHHLVVDGISWRVLLEDLHTALDQRRKGQPITLPSKSTSFQTWSQQLQAYAQSDAAAAALDYWLASVFQQTLALPRDQAARDAVNTTASTHTITQQLSENETRALLEDVPGVYHTQINDVLLTAIAQTFSNWLQSDSVLFALEGHGRESLFEDIDVTRTVGWFTSVFPVRLSLPKSDDLGQTILSIKEQLRALPENGISHGLLKYSARYGARFAGLAEPEILFNYLGQTDALLGGLHDFALESDSVGEARFPDDQRRYLIEINSYVRDGRLQSRWEYSSNFHAEVTIQKLANGFDQALRAIIDHCASPQAGGHSVSDFPLADLNADSFEQIASLLDATDN
jgi:non-ribosomal peptide synthase protein (TIGR01720 family)